MGTAAEHPGWPSKPRLRVVPPAEAPDPWAITNQLKDEGFGLLLALACLFLIGLTLALAFTQGQQWRCERLRADNPARAQQVCGPVDR